MAVSSDSKTTYYIVPAFISAKGVKSGEYEVANIESKVINFPPRVRPADYALKPTTGTFSLTKYSSGWGYNRYPAGERYTTIGYNTAPLSVPSVPTGTMLRQVDASLRGKIQKMSVSVADSIGEYNETLGLFKAAVNIVKDFWQLRKGRIPPRWAALTRQGLTRQWTPRDVSAAWIAKQFAIEPVIGLLSDSLGQFTKSNNGLVIIPFKSSRSEFTQKTVQSRDYNLFYQAQVQIMHQLVVEYNSTVPSFSLGNPLEWVWAAIPFSFVVDWFFGVGAYLSQLNDIPSNTRILCGTSALAKTGKISVYPNHPPYPGSGVQSTYAGGAYKEVFTLERAANAILADPPLPSLHLADRQAASSLLVTALALLHLVGKR